MDKLHQLWQSHASELSASSDSFSNAAKGLPLHGCRLKVIESKDPRYVGREGVVIEHSKAFFHVATICQSKCQADGNRTETCVRLSHVPKTDTMTTFTFPARDGMSRLVTVNGSNLK